MNKKVAIFSDIHLGVHQNSEFWLKTSLDWVRWFEREITAKGISDVIFCGDLFHDRSSIEVTTLDTASKLLDLLSDKIIYMIPGNHDSYFKDHAEINSLSIFKGRTNVHIFDKVETLNIGGKMITFCPWGTKVEDIPKSDVLFGHFEMLNFRMNAFKICEHGADPDTFFDKFPLTISGHFHMKDERKFEGKGTILYVGNPFQMDFGDAYQQKGYYTFDIDTLKYEFFECDWTPKHLKIYLSKLIESDPDIYFDHRFNNAIINLTIDKNISEEHLELLIAKFNECNPVEVRIDYDANINNVVVADTNCDLSGIAVEQAIDEFIKLLEIDNHKEVTQYCVDLYNRSK